MTEIALPTMGSRRAEAPRDSEEWFRAARRAKALSTARALVSKAGTCLSPNPSELVCRTLSARFKRHAHQTSQLRAHRAVVLAREVRKCIREVSRRAKDDLALHCGAFHRMATTESAPARILLPDSPFFRVSSGSRG